MRETGTYALDELLSDIDGSTAYRFDSGTVDIAMADSWNACQEEPNPRIQWTVDDLEDDDRDLDISVSPAMFTTLVRKAREYDRIMALCVHAPRCECE